jgi:RNA polymerase sigma factor (sigma-70 family)
MNLSKEFWEKTYKENAPKMIGVCRRYVADIKIAEDLMHDAFITAINKHDSFRGEGRFEAWLRKITVNTALMYVRSERMKKIKENWMQSDNAYESPDYPDSESMRNAIENAGFSDVELLEVIDNLPSHHKQVFNLYVIDNFSHVQIGRELGISPGTSKSHLARARKKIQQTLYQKAIEKYPGQQKRKSAGLLLLFTPFKLYYIDRLFKNRLSNFAIPPASGSDLLFQSIPWDTISKPLIKPSFIATKLHYVLVGTTCSLFVTFLAVHNSRKDSGNVNIPVSDSIISDTIKLVPVLKDSFIQAVNPPVKKNNINAVKNNQPVIIRRTTIRRKTITVRDTVTIYDTTDVQ